MEPLTFEDLLMIYGGSGAVRYEPPIYGSQPAPNFTTSGGNAQYRPPGSDAFYDKYKVNITNANGTTGYTSGNSTGSGSYNVGGVSVSY